ncbi:MAG: hypothetical protein LBT60_07565 [Oscillospiraceae bacterium]|jgi:hypothetical protein|nr:hypothetical protein [Oscillospiraceae bacterium]
MKKTLSILLAVVFMAAFAVPSAFAGSFDDSAQQHDDAVTGHDTDSPITRIIPMYGYVGKDTNLIDPDPDNPDQPPQPADTEINLAVPIKIIWAAFASDEGLVTSPTYTVKNFSTAHKVKISVVKFEAGFHDPSANGVVDSTLVLNLVGSYGQFGQINLLNVGTYKTAITDIGTDLGSSTNWNFRIAGTYTGTFATAYQPSYVLTFKFTYVA